MSSAVTPPSHHQQNLSDCSSSETNGSSPFECLSESEVNLNGNGHQQQQSSTTNGHRHGHHEEQQQLMTSSVTPPSSMSSSSALSARLTDNFSQQQLLSSEESPFGHQFALPSMSSSFSRQLSNNSSSAQQLQTAVSPAMSNAMTTSSSLATSGLHHHQQQLQHKTDGSNGVVGGIVDLKTLARAALVEHNSQATNSSSLHGDQSQQSQATTVGANQSASPQQMNVTTTTTTRHNLSLTSDDDDQVFTTPSAMAAATSSTSPTESSSSMTTMLSGWMSNVQSPSLGATGHVVNGLMSRLASKAKSSVDGFITTLDPGMKAVLYSGGDINVLVASMAEDSKVSPVREAFIDVFGRATVKGLASSASSIAPQPVGAEAAMSACEERIANIRKNHTADVPQNQLMVAVENFLVELSPDSWFDVGCVLLDDPLTSTRLVTYSQATPVPNEVINHLKFETQSLSSPELAHIKETGFAITTGQLMAARLDCGKEEWHEALVGIPRSSMVYLAACAVARLFKDKLLEKGLVKNY